MQEKEEEMRREIRGRRRYATGAVLTAGILAMAAVAWACTVQIGILTVCSPKPLLSYQSGECAKKDNVNGTGSQVGSISMKKEGGSPMSIIGDRFVGGDNYSIMFASPKAVASGANCHDYTRPGVVSLLGYAPMTGQQVENNEPAPVTVKGPSWTVGSVSPNVTLLGGAPYTGSARVCVQDFPNRVNGTQITVAIV